MARRRGQAMLHDRMRWCSMEPTAWSIRLLSAALIFTASIAARYLRALDGWHRNAAGRLVEKLWRHSGFLYRSYRVHKAASCRQNASNLEREIGADQKAKERASSTQSKAFLDRLNLLTINNLVDPIRVHPFTMENFLFRVCFAFQGMFSRFDDEFQKCLSAESQMLAGSLSQFSTLIPGTRENSPTFAVTMVAPIERAWAAMIVSLSPIFFPSVSRAVRTVA